METFLNVIVTKLACSFNPEDEEHKPCWMEGTDAFNIRVEEGSKLFHRQGRPIRCGRPICNMTCIEMSACDLHSLRECNRDNRTNTATRVFNILGSECAQETFLKNIFTNSNPNEQRLVDKVLFVNDLNFGVDDNNINYKTTLAMLKKIFCVGCQAVNKVTCKCDNCNCFNHVAMYFNLNHIDDVSKSVLTHGLALWDNTDGDIRILTDNETYMYIYKIELPCVCDDSDSDNTETTNEYEELVKRIREMSDTELDELTNVLNEICNNERQARKSRR